MAGKLVIIGGAEDQKQHCTILKTVLRISGETNPRVAVIAAASAEPVETGQEYEQIFEELGAESVRVLQVNSRSSAQDHSSAAVLQEAAVIFITGGDQLRLTSILGGTALMEKLWMRFQSGAILAGTSAGASAMSETMIIGGSADQPPQRGLIHMSPGFGFLPRVLVDQHFAQRGRFGRLIAAIALNPGFWGMGIDENTAVVVSEGRWVDVIGSNGVTMIDGRSLIHTNVTETAPRETLTLSALQVHVLAQGAGFDLHSGGLSTSDKL